MFCDCACRLFIFAQKKLNTNKNDNLYRKYVKRTIASMLTVAPIRYDVKLLWPVCVCKVSVHCRTCYMLVSVSSRNYIHTTDAQTHLTNNSSITQHININYCPKQSVQAVISCLNLIYEHACFSATYSFIDLCPVIQIKTRKCNIKRES